MKSPLDVTENISNTEQLLSTANTNFVHKKRNLRPQTANIKK
jgi:hypothetical protein